MDVHREELMTKVFYPKSVSRYLKWDMISITCDKILYECTLQFFRFSVFVLILPPDRYGYYFSFFNFYWCKKRNEEREPGKHSYQKEI